MRAVGPPHGGGVPGPIGPRPGADGPVPIRSGRTVLADLLQGLRAVARQRGGPALLAGLTAAVSAGFVLVMRIATVQPFSASDLAIALAFGGLISLNLAMSAMAGRRGPACDGEARRSARWSAGTVVGVVATAVSCMCCLPILPLLVGGLIAGSAASISAATAAAVVRWAVWGMYGASAVLLLASLVGASRRWVDSVDGPVPA